MIASLLPRTQLFGKTQPIIASLKIPKAAQFNFGKNPEVLKQDETVSDKSGFKGDTVDTLRTFA
jgi:hypothetical protein